MIPRRPRPPRLVAVPPLAALALVAVLPGAPAQASRSTSCAAHVRAAAARTDAGGTFVRVGRSSTVEVFAATKAGTGAYHYACRRRDGVLHRFARDSTGATSGPDRLTVSFRVRGSDVAYRTTEIGDAASTDEFVVIDGRTGEVLRDTGRLGSREHRAPREDQLQLLSRARIAWATKALGVHVLDDDGDHLLAPASNGEAYKLRATATRLSWTAGGERRHARLP